MSAEETSLLIFIGSILYVFVSFMIALNVGYGVSDKDKARWILKFTFWPVYLVGLALYGAWWVVSRALGRE